MGRGDAKTKQGKRTRGSNGNARPSAKKLRNLAKVKVAQAAA
jgi:ribosomal small subunit protein bTHX